MFKVMCSILRREEGKERVESLDDTAMFSCTDFRTSLLYKRMTTMHSYLK